MFQHLTVDDSSLRMAFNDLCISLRRTAIEQGTWQDTCPCFFAWLQHIRPLVPARSAFTEHSAQHDSAAVTPVLDVALAATHFCLGKVQSEARSRYLLSYGQFAASGGMVVHHQDTKALFYLSSSYRDLFS